jgi:hypothetical protein
VYVKSYLPGFVCACLVWFGSTAPAGAQPPAAPPAAGTPQAPNGQTPTGQGEPSQEPDVDTSLANLPELPKIPEVQMPGERGFSVGASLWWANSKPEFEKGSFALAYLGNIRMEGAPKVNQAFDGAFALGLHNVLRISYFETRAAGNEYAPTELGLYQQVYSLGDYLATDYFLRSAKLSFDYLTWPYPVKTSKFRLKTLWQLQYMEVRTGFDAPLKTFTVENTTWATTEIHRFTLPEFGIGTQYWVTRGFRVETRGAGMSIPHHQNSWDFEGSLNFRAGPLELQVGYKGYHFRTSAQQDFWVRGTMVGPFVGLHWYSDSMATK